MLTVHAICRTTDQIKMELDDLPVIGSVYSIHDDECCAIVSESEEISYVHLEHKAALEHLLVHQRIVEATMPFGPLVPVKFGTVLPGEKEVLQLLKQTKEVVELIQAEYEDMVQMEIAIMWDSAEVFQAISQLSSVVELKKEAENGHPEARVQLGAHVKQLMDEKRNAYAADIIPQIKLVVEKMVVHPVMADEVVCNAAVLIDENKEDVLDRVLVQIDEQYKGKFTLKCLGPMPMYSFATLTASKVSVDVIEQACRILELPSPATLGGIKRAYRKKAQQLHPDSQREQEKAEESISMSEVAAAYRLLYAFAKSQLMNSEFAESDRCHFDQHAVENTLLISIEKHTEEEQVPVS